MRKTLSIAILPLSLVILAGVAKALKGDGRRGGHLETRLTALERSDPGAAAEGARVSSPRT
jgi:hypothetical protein